MSTVFTAVTDGVNLSAVTEENVRIAFVVRLPFRIPLGRLRRYVYDDQFDVWIRNKIDLPPGTTFQQAMPHMRTGEGRLEPNVLFSEALIVNRKVKVKPDSLESVRKITKNDELPPIECDKMYFLALKALNDFLVAFHTATKELFGGTPISRLSNMEFFNNVRFEITLICPDGKEVDAALAEELLNSQVEREFLRGQQYNGEWGDVPEERLALIQKALELQERFIFYEFAFEAKCRMVEQDYVGALLYAVVAFEGAHAAYLKLGLDRKFSFITDERKREKVIDEHAERLLKEAGISAIYRLTPVLFMDVDERPSEEELEKCGKGITMRNEIMHSLAKKGQYKLRNRTAIQLTEAYSAVLRVYDRFVVAIEKEVCRSM
jgi:hypothetical protein